MDDHVYTIGYERDDSDVVNLFIARYNAEVRFNSFDDYKIGKWSRLRIHELMLATLMYKVLRQILK